MVSGINYGNYSASQLKELKNNGVQVPDEAIKTAEKKEATAINKTDDNQEVKYEIADDASKTNEAQKEVETAKEYGANLKTILETLMKKDEGFITDMATLQGEIDKFQVETESTNKELTDVNAEVEKTTTKAENEAKTVQQQIEEKQKEYETKMKELETLQQKEDSSEEDQAKMQKLQGEIQTLHNNMYELATEGDSIAEDSKVTLEQAQAKAESVGRTMEGVKMEAEAAASKATDANEYAEVTIEKGTEASNITSKKEAKNAGFKKSGFLGFGKKGNVKAANRMGNMAIATGEQLGGATVNIAKSVETIADQYQFSMSKTSNVKNLANKEYVDTTKFAEAKQTVNETKGFKKFKANIDLKNAAGEVAEASKNKGKKTETATTEMSNSLADLIKNGKVKVTNQKAQQA